VRKHALPVLKDVDYRSFSFYAGFALLAKDKFNRDGSYHIPAGVARIALATRAARRTPVAAGMRDRDMAEAPECGTFSAECGTLMTSPYTIDTDSNSSSWGKTAQHHDIGLTESVFRTLMRSDW
jgi:hypothetical protein